MNAQETLPSELRMTAPPSLPQARSYLFKQRSEYTTYDMGKSTKIRINIPRLQRTYLSKDSYLRFRINLEVLTPAATVGNNSAGALYLDRAGAYSLFDRMEVYDYMGGTLIEQISNIPALVCMLNDLGTPIEAFNANLQATQGFQGSTISCSTNTLLTSSQVDGYEMRTANSGLDLLSSGWNSGIATQNTPVFFTYEFAIPLLGFLGNYGKKFVPLHNGFSIDLYLNNVNQAFVSFGQNNGSNPAYTPDYTLPPRPLATNPQDDTRTRINEVWFSNVEFCAQVMELGNDAENLVLASNGSGPLVVPAVFYRYFTDLVKGYEEPDQTSEIGIDLNLNVVSLRNIRFGMRPAKWQNLLTHPAYGHRLRNYLESFSFRYGSSFLPELAGIGCRSANVPTSKSGSTTLFGSDWWKQKGYNQAYAELMKTGIPGQWYDSKCTSSISGTEFETDLQFAPSNPSNPGTTNVEWYNKNRFDQANVQNSVPPLGKYWQYVCGKFMGGIDLRLSSKDVVSGIDTNGLLVRLNAKFDDANLYNVVNAILDVYAEYDAFVQIIPGVATTVSF